MGQPETSLILSSAARALDNRYPLLGSAAYGPHEATFYDSCYSSSASLERVESLLEIGAFVGRTC